MNATVQTADPSAARPAVVASPFDLGRPELYRRWRTAKLADRPQRVEDLRVDIADPTRLTDDERRAIVARCRRANMAIYRLPPGSAVGKDAIRAMGHQLGLSRLDDNLCADEDGITSLQVMADGRQGWYIPYSDRPLSWHTDGYYNPPERRIRAILMHCVASAASGGANALIDHELVYLQLRDEDPELVQALMAPDAMTIPANAEQGREIRGAESGPVFSVDPVTGNLHMRYTARRRHILWKDDARTRAAVERLHALTGPEALQVFEYRLGPGEGVVCNNVLHNRSGFTDEPGRQRLHYRARYYDRIAGTDVAALRDDEVMDALA